MEKNNSGQYSKDWESESIQTAAMDALLNVDQGKVRILRGPQMLEGKVGKTDKYRTITHEVDGEIKSYDLPIYGASGTREIKIAEPSAKSSLDTADYLDEASETSSSEAAILEQVDDPKFQAWFLEHRKEMLTVDEVHEWAASNIASAEDYDRMVPCHSCVGSGEWKQWCVCRLVTGNFAIDSGCTECSGTGEVLDACQSCDGEGEEPLYPKMTLHNPLANTSREIPFDLAMMIREYPEGVKQGYEIEDYALGQYLDNLEIPVVALEQSDDSVALGDYNPPEEFALLLGEEVHGIEPSYLKKCDATIEIPMVGQKESFNVSVATGIALYGLTTVRVRQV